MAHLDDAARAWLATQHQAVLVTLRADGSPQSSNVITSFDGTAFSVSVTDDRAKTHNLRRDPRAVVHVLGPDFWSYASTSCDVEVGPVSATAGDDAGRALLELRDAVSDEPHPDPDEFLTAMVDEQRLVLRLTPHSVAGQGW